MSTEPEPLESFVHVPAPATVQPESWVVVEDDGAVKSVAGFAMEERRSTSPVDLCDVPHEAPPVPPAPVEATPTIEGETEAIDAPSAEAPPTPPAASALEPANRIVHTPPAAPKSPSPVGTPDPALPPPAVAYVPPPVPPPAPAALAPCPMQQTCPAVVPQRTPPAPANVFPPHHVEADRRELAIATAVQAREIEREACRAMLERQRLDREEQKQAERARREEQRLQQRAVEEAKAKVAEADRQRAAVLERERVEAKRSQYVAELLQRQEDDRARAEEAAMEEARRVAELEEAKSLMFRQQQLLADEAVAREMRGGGGGRAGDAPPTCACLGASKGFHRLGCEQAH